MTEPHPKSRPNPGDSQQTTIDAPTPWPSSDAARWTSRFVARTAGDKHEIPERPHEGARRLAPSAKRAARGDADAAGADSDADLQPASSYDVMHMNAEFPETQTRTARSVPSSPPRT
jgi:hypothetical protein